jgi:hypothetical protein
MSDEQTMIDPELEPIILHSLETTHSLYKEVAAIAKQYNISTGDVLAAAWYALAEPGCEKAVAEFNEWLRWHQTQRGNNNG